PKSQPRKVRVVPPAPDHSRPLEHLPKLGFGSNCISKVYLQAPASASHITAPRRLKPAPSKVLPEPRAPGPVGAHGQSHERMVGQRLNEAGPLALGYHIIPAHALPPRTGMAVQKCESTSL